MQLSIFVLTDESGVRFYFSIKKNQAVNRDSFYIISNDKKYVKYFFKNFFKNYRFFVIKSIFSLFGFGGVAG